MSKLATIPLNPEEEAVLRQLVSATKRSRNKNAAALSALVARLLRTARATEASASKDLTAVSVVAKGSLPIQGRFERKASQPVRAISTSSAFVDCNVLLGDNALGGLTTGVENVGIGCNAGSAIDVGNRNVCVGTDSDALPDAENAIAIGYQTVAEESNTAVIGNTDLNELRMFGASMLKASAPLKNYFVGDAGNKTSTGTENAGFGPDALAALTAGVGNVSVGSAAGSTLTTGTNNVCIGHEADTATASDQNAIAIGYQAVAGTNKIALGNANNNEILALGYSLVKAPGTRNWFVGDSGNLTTTGGANVALGSLALISVTSGTNNTAIGDQALTAHTTSTGNVAVGSSAMKASITCTDCTAIGFEALKSVTSGVGATAVGRLSCSTMSVATNNTALGDSTLRFTTSGEGNTAVGYRAMEANTTGNSNVAVGRGAGISKTTGSENTMVGTSALAGASSGSANTAIGFQALNAHAGDNSTAIGHNALLAATGANNTATGKESGLSLTTGSNNIFLGADAGNSASQKVDAVNSIAIGFQAFTTSNNQVVLGNSDIVQTLIRGNTGINTTNPDLFGRGYQGQLGISSSGYTGLAINAASDAAVFVDLGVNSARAAYIRTDSSSTEFGTLGTTTLSLVTNSTIRGSFDGSGKFSLFGSLSFHPGSSNTPAANGDVTFELASNTSLVVKARGSDGVVRSAAITLA
jgi:hypothetical protein